MDGRPTPHAEVNTLPGELLGGVRAVLGSQFVGAYLFGSPACGDFDRDSDVDVLVVTEGELSGEQFEALRATHERLARADSPWATQLEVSYIPRAALRYDGAASVRARAAFFRGRAFNSCPSNYSS